MTTAPTMPAWERRFRAPALMLPAWARHAEDRLVYASNETGAWQLYAWDRAAGRRRRVTDVAVGVMAGLPTPDGTGVVWFLDETGDEIGTWVVEPFDGGGRPGADRRRPLAPGVPAAWTSGLAVGDGVAVVGTAGEDGFAVYRSEKGGPAELLHRDAHVVDVGGLSRDGTLVALAHAEHGDALHLALRVLDVGSGKVAGDLWDGAGLGLAPGPWSPLEGDHRLAIESERSGARRPGVWDLRSGARHDIELDLPGDVGVLGWWPDASALLLAQTSEGRDRLLRHDLGSGATEPLDHPDGTVLAARVRPDGDVWYHFSHGAGAPSVRSLATGEIVLAPEGEAPPPGYPYRSWHFGNGRGQRVHGFLVEPPGERPHPLVMLVHGGPHWLWADAWRPEVPAWVDHGFAVALVNYRGSTGYGTEWRDTLTGNPGFPELEDLVAGVDDLVGSGVADPARVVLAGGSWGGYLALLGLGREPGRWAAGVAVIPVADYVAAFEDEAPSLKELDRMLFGGDPTEKPDLYAERSPITYADRVQAPVLIIAGDNDSRCPIRQVLNYVERLEAAGGDVEFHRFDAGHGSLVIEERVTHMALELDFVARRLG